MPWKLTAAGALNTAISTWTARSWPPLWPTIRAAASVSRSGFGAIATAMTSFLRSEERRVGKECGSRLTWESKERNGNEKTEERSGETQKARFDCQATVLSKGS